MSQLPCKTFFKKIHTCGPGVDSSGQLWDQGPIIPRQLGNFSTIRNKALV